MWSILCLVVCACALGFARELEPYSHENAHIHFERFIVQHGREYAHEQEKQMRFEIFKANLEKANRMNEKSETAEFGITQFMDLTPEEFIQKHTGFINVSDPSANVNCSIIIAEDMAYGGAPESFDWRDHNAVTPVKNQEGCGSCYAFAVAGNVEGQYAIKHKQMLSLSEQQIIDCDKLSFGCGGGYMQNSILSLLKAGGSESENDYPYEAKSVDCRFDASKVKVKVIGCHAYDLKSAETLKQLLYHNGPIVIGVRGNPLQAYVSGIMNEESCEGGNLNHAVLLVGYGVENNVPFWTVKNSWGLTFGEKGYFRVKRGEHINSCGMMNNAMCSAVVA